MFLYCYGMLSTDILYLVFIAYRTFRKSTLLLFLYNITYIIV